MKTMGAWKVLLAMGTFAAISVGATGCASEADIDESESAVGTAEATPFDEQYLDVSVAWPGAKVAEFIHGDPMDYDYTGDCTFELSLLQDGQIAPILTIEGTSSYRDEGKGAGILSRDQLTRKALGGTLDLRCSNDEAKMSRSARFELPQVRFTDKLGAAQTLTVIPKLEGIARKDIPITLSLKVNHSRGAAGILSNCSAFSNLPKDKVQKSFLSASTRYESSSKDFPFGGGKVTTTLSIDGGKLKKEFELSSEKKMFVPIAYCRAKGGFGSEGVLVDVLGSYGSLSSNKPFTNTTREHELIKVNTPMKSGEERMIRHNPPKGSAAFDTVLRMY